MSLYKKDLVTIANHLLHKYLCRSFSVLWSERWFSFLLLLRICTLGNWYVWMQRSCPVNFFFNSDSYSMMIWSHFPFDGGWMNTLKNAQGKLKWNELHGQLWSSYILNSVEWSFMYTYLQFQKSYSFWCFGLKRVLNSYNVVVAPVGRSFECLMSENTKLLINDLMV